MTDRPQIAGGGPEFHLTGGVLTIYLAALADNWRTLDRLSAPAKAAAVVKANAYGLGTAEVAPALVEAGCTRFFVALPYEGIALRAVAREVEIFVLSGPLSAETAASFREHRLVPVLNSLRDIAIWEAEGWDGDTQLPAALHVDTGMNRLGLTPAEAARFSEDNALTRAVQLNLVMSHLACADEPEHPLNRRQLDSFQQVAALFPGIESSLSNSAGIMLGGHFLRDLTRPGIALYGGADTPAGADPIRTVVRAQAHILQIRSAMAGETVGYGATMTLQRDTLIGIVAAGYADGYHRTGSGSGVPLRQVSAGGAAGYIAGHRVPVLGRITMDLTAFDLTELGDSVSPGDLVELFGPNIPLQEAAQTAGTIPYELLTSLGRRYHRVYLRGDAAP